MNNVDKNDPYCLLANAIFIKSCKDYTKQMEKAIYTFYRNFKYRTFEDLLVDFTKNKRIIINSSPHIYEYDHFFKSEWCKLLTDVNIDRVVSEIDSNILKNFFNKYCN